MSELKPCPFCGSKGRLHRECFGMAIECTKCSSGVQERPMWTSEYTFFNTEEEAADFWNARPIEDALTAELTRAKEMLAVAKKALKESEQGFLYIGFVHKEVNGITMEARIMKIRKTLAEINKMKEE